MPAAILQFAALQAAFFALALVLTGRASRPADFLLVVAIELTLESSVAGLLSFTGTNSRAAYWLAAAVCAALAFVFRRRAALKLPSLRALPLVIAVLVPLAFLSFHPVDEIDSINYLHYLIEWMANRTTPYDFATYYVAFWELSFLPTWVVTGVDFFFPLLALKSVVLFALAAWLLGRDLRVKTPLLALTVMGSCTLLHLWAGPAGVPTLKNDTLHGAGFLLLALVAVRAARRPLERKDILLLAAGIIFAPVKYLGIFIVPIALAIILWHRWREVDWRAAAAISLAALATTWHYYLHHVIAYGSPFYPVQINLGPIHLPGTADLSNTSILWNIRNPEVWRIFFLPEGGISPAGLLFPLILALTLVLSAALLLRRTWRPLAFLVLCGWLLYFRSALGAGGGPGDLHFIRNDLNTLRYAEGALAAGELMLAALFPRIAAPFLGVNLASRLYLLYRRIPIALFPIPLIAACSLAAALVFVFIRRPKLQALLAAAALLIACPLLIERNRVLWTPYWNDLKPDLAAVRGQDLAVLALTDGGYFAGHVVAAGNPVNPAVRCFLPEQMDALLPTQRPRYLAVLFSPGSDAANTWRNSVNPTWGYTPVRDGKYGMLLRRQPALN
jgi:hypothetical protein